MCDGETILKDVSHSLQDKSIFVKDECCVMMVDQNERDSFSLDVKEWISQIMDFMKR
jgi:hypothetical protein